MGLQRDVIYLDWPIAPSYMSPKCRGGGELRCLSQWVQLYTGAHINFGDLTPYWTYDIIERMSENILFTTLARVCSAAASIIDSIFSYMLIIRNLLYSVHLNECRRFLIGWKIFCVQCEAGLRSQLSVASCVSSPSESLGKRRETLNT